LKITLVSIENDDRAAPAPPLVPMAGTGGPLFDEHETALPGCDYLQPTDKAAPPGHLRWVVDELVSSEVAQALDELVPARGAADWPLTGPRFVGRDLIFEEWHAHPRTAQ
jgi:hypothetical protein